MSKVSTPNADTQQRDSGQSIADAIISKAIGAELRRTREALGWSRAQVVGMLPSGIGDRTLLSYEKGTRNLTVLRLLELGRAYGVTPATVINQALQRARIQLANLVLMIDLHKLLADGSSDKYRPMIQWARNKLNEHPEGVVPLPPSSVKELATFAGYTYEDLANWLARFIPDDIPEELWP